jgi:hypothetical protein
MSVERFNRRDWDGLRELIKRRRARPRRRLLRGMLDKAPYLGEYECATGRMM